MGIVLVAHHNNGRLSKQTANVRSGCRESAATGRRCKLVFREAITHFWYTHGAQGERSRFLRLAVDEIAEKLRRPQEALANRTEQLRG